MSNYLGRMAFDQFCDSIGAQAEWDDCCASRQAAWNSSANELLLKMVRSPEFYALLKAEIASVKTGLYQSNQPILQSREFLYQQINSLAEELRIERELVDQQRRTYSGWLKDHHIPEDTEEPLQKEWMQTYFFSLSVKLPSGADIEFDTWGNDWYAWITDLNLLHQRRRLCILKTRGDFRRLLQCFGVKDWEREDEDYD